MDSHSLRIGSYNKEGEHKKGERAREKDKTEPAGPFSREETEQETEKRKSPSVSRISKCPQRQKFKGNRKISD